MNQLMIDRDHVATMASVEVPTLRFGSSARCGALVNETNPFKSRSPKAVHAYIEVGL